MSSNYQDAYFTVTRPNRWQAACPSIALARASTRSAVAGSATYRFNPQWEVTGYVRYDRLVGDAADSPITVLTGSPNQWTFGAIVGYSFDIRIP